MRVFGLKIRFYPKLVTINQTQQTIFLRVAVWKCWTKKKYSNGAKFRPFNMTILPKKKSSQQSKSDRDGADRGVDSVQYSPRGLSQNQVRFFFLAKPIMFDSSWPTFVYTWYFETLHFWSYFLSLSVVLSQFRLRAFRVSGTNDVSTIGCDLVLLPSPYEVVIGIWLIIKKVSFEKLI